MTLWYSSPSSQISVTSKLTLGSLCPITKNFNEVVAQGWTQYRPPRYTAGYWPPTRLCAADNHPLGLTIQTVFNPPHHLFIQPTHQQLVYKGKFLKANLNNPEDS